MWKERLGATHDVSPTGSGNRENLFIAGFRAQWAHFLAAIRGEAPPPQLEEQVKSLGADITKVENWGKRRLAYDIAKQREGTYAIFEVSAEPSTIKEFERQLRLNENVLRFMSTRVPARKKARSAKAPEAAVVEEVV